jgi:CrcB protein
MEFAGNIPQLGLMTPTLNAWCGSFSFYRSAMENVVLVFLGGGIGALARYGLDGAVYRLVNTTYPLGTFVVNIVGSFIIGVLMASLGDRFLLQPSLRIFLAFGVLGGFTTFSTFSFESIRLLESAQYLYASINVISTITLCLAATFVGMTLGKLI